MNRKLSALSGTVQSYGRFICILQRVQICFVQKQSSLQVLASEGGRSALRTSYLILSSHSHRKNWSQQRAVTKSLKGFIKKYFSHLLQLGEKSCNFQPTPRLTDWWHLWVCFVVDLWDSTSEYGKRTQLQNCVPGECYWRGANSVQITNVLYSVRGYLLISDSS